MPCSVDSLIYLVDSDAVVARTSHFLAVPFDEDDKDKSVWFLDHDYLENMYGMFKKVNGKCTCRLEESNASLLVFCCL